MKIPKKIFAIILALSLLSVTACQKNTNTDSNSEKLSISNADDNLFGNIDDAIDDNSNNEAPDGESTTKRNNSANGTTSSKSPEKAETTANQSNQKPVVTSTQKVGEIKVKKEEFKANNLTQIVYYPDNISESEKKYPVIIWANGTGCAPSMYDGLLTLLAKGGYIVVANSDTMAADGSSQRGSLDFIISQSNNSSSIFYRHIDNSSVGVAGHSQGGRSSVNAAAADNRIKCVLSLAGSNYKEEAEKLTAPTFFISGTNDVIVNANMWLVPAYENCKGPAVYASAKKAVHTTCCSNPSVYSGYALKWFDAWLKNDKEAMGTFRNGGALSNDGNWTDFACKGI